MYLIFAKRNTYYVLKMHFGVWSPANPAFKMPVPCATNGKSVSKAEKGGQQKRARYVIDDNRLVKDFLRSHGRQTSHFFVSHQVLLVSVDRKYKLPFYSRPQRPRFKHYITVQRFSLLASSSLGSSTSCSGFRGGTVCPHSTTNFSIAAEYSFQFMGQLKETEN